MGFVRWSDGGLREGPAVAVLRGEGGGRGVRMYPCVWAVGGGTNGRAVPWPDMEMGWD